MICLNKNKGFTLVELIIVVAIIGIIASFAYPSYVENVKSAKRAEAMAALTNAAQALEQRRTANYSYVVPDLSAVFATQVPVEGGDAYYNLSVVTTATTYTLTASPVAGMAGDGDLTLTHTGAKTWGGNPGWPD